MNQSESSSSSLFSLFQASFLGVGVLLLIVSLFGASTDLDHFFQVYLFGFLFWLNLAVGCLGWLLLVSVVDAPWTYSLKRIASAGARTLPLLAVFSIPLLVRLDLVFPWAMDGVELKDGKEVYLNENFFALRTVVYFVIWIALAYLVSGALYDNDDPNKSSRSVTALSVLGIVLYFLTATFAAFDWVMSLDYESFSSIFGWLVMSQQMLVALAFIVLVLAFFWQENPMARLATPRVVGDLSSLLLVALLVWGYMNVIQYIVMWSGNISDKVNLYVIRSEGAWEPFIPLMFLLHAIAFAILVMPIVRRMRSVLVVIAALLFVGRIIEMFWITFPPYMGSEINLFGWEFAMWLSIGGFWLALFVWMFGRYPILPQNDPILEKHLETPQAEIYHTNGSVVRTGAIQH